MMSEHRALVWCKRISSLVPSGRSKLLHLAVEAAIIVEIRRTTGDKSDGGLE